MNRITLKFPKPLSLLDSKGKEKPMPYFDWDGLFEPKLTENLGEIELELELAGSAEIRVTGNYIGMKTVQVREMVSELLGEAMEGIDTTAYAVQ
jgi:hypothetical protein